MQLFRRVGFLDWGSDQLMKVRGILSYVHEQVSRLHING